MTVNALNSNANPPDLLLTNAELRDIESRHAEDDEDVRHLIAFIFHLKRKLGDESRKVSEQRKQLNAIRAKRANTEGTWMVRDRIAKMVDVIKRLLCRVFGHRWILTPPPSMIRQGDPLWECTRCEETLFGLPHHRKQGLD